MSDLLKVLHLTGSPESQFFADLSLLYASGCLESACDPNRFESVIAYISPNGQWRFPKSLGNDSIATADPMSFANAMQHLEKTQIDVVIPQMFCQAGMTHYRSLSDLLDVPMVGNPASVMAIASDKVLTRNVVSAAGVRVPEATVLRRRQLHEAGSHASLDSQIKLLSEKLPLIVKPASADNSVGVSLANTENDLREAVEVAFAHCDKILIEQYIPLGREVRCGVIQRGKELVCLPLQEYRMEGNSALIRATSSKLTQTNDGNLDLTSKHNPQSWIVDVDDSVTRNVWNVAQICHESLGCRDYSLFDFRIDSDGRPWFLEAGLYCSFSPSSILVAMAEASNISLKTLFEEMVEQSMQAKLKPSDSATAAAPHTTEELAGHGASSPPLAQ